MTAGQEYDDVERFRALKARLPGIWSALGSDTDYAHTSVIVPSLSVNQEELGKVIGASFYEERLLFALIRLRNPNARVIYITSQPLHPDIIDYYLDLLDGVPKRHARERFFSLSVWDGSSRPLSLKVLERPRFIRQIRRLITDPEHSYLTCYNSTVLERRLAVALDLPLNGLDPDLLCYATKSGNRRVFGEAGVNYPLGSEDLHSRDDILAALIELGRARPTLERAVVKLNEGFGGEGNAVFTYPADREDRSAVESAFEQMRWTSGIETIHSFLRKFEAMGGIVEEMVAGSDIRSPSVQMRISPAGKASLVSSHEQVLGGSTGQSYLGCTFPADDAYRGLLLREAKKIGDVLSTKGVTGRFAIDFLVYRDSEGEWNAAAIEINLRMGGTTPPFHALEFLTGGHLDPDSGLFLDTDGDPKYYKATDNLKSPAYRGLLPEDLMQIVSKHGLGFRHSTGTGALFHMIGALSQYGKIGMTCIANCPREAEELFEHTTRVLDDEAAGEGHGVQAPLLDRYLKME
ncbi:MAG: peptide ligase PGM1-related protein [Woeseiaceae bacterium]|nr:peptide ligase PGM1-related protein [Woeseiaceae bacterium]